MYFSTEKIHHHSSEVNHTIIQEMRHTAPQKWSPVGQRANIPNVPCVLPPGLSQPLLTAVLLRAKYEEISYRLSNIPQEAPSVIAFDESFSRTAGTDYGSKGARDDTGQRMKRARDALFATRRNVISEIDSFFPVFRIPASIRIAFTKCTRKFYIANSNMIGFILGPRGESLRALESEFRVRISIRGKGSTVNARSSSDKSRQTDEEPLHALVEANTEANLDKCIKRLEQLTTPVPDNENERKKEQLRQLAILNGVGIADVSVGEQTKQDHPPWFDENLDREHSAELDAVMALLNQEITSTSAQVEPTSRSHDRFSIDLDCIDVSVLIPEPQPPGL